MSETLQAETDGLSLLERRIANSVDDVPAVMAKQATRDGGFEVEDQISDRRMNTRMHQL